jgi:hypothetical protein
MKLRPQKDPEATNQTSRQKKQNLNITNQFGVINERILSVILIIIWYIIKILFIAAMFSLAICTWSQNIIHGEHGIKCNTVFSTM